MIQFDRLTLSGFKSFVDKTDLDINPGLTGIVGPNGCGKSNLVEALRWAMGESSAKRMRGGDMDDVIFNGTTGRPARNFAEVVMVLNNGMHTAPEPYAAFDQIEISRRIEREQGSTYRINGKVARARDVQLLLADTMTGANSPALVSQGKLTQIISAKPFDRRMILEESAGITGLHARRHEAELRLQAADNNLARLQDSMGNLETQLNSLKRQSRQAEKYRALTDEIKTLETTIAAMEWVKLTRQKQLGEHQLTSIESEVAEALLAVTQLNQTFETQSSDLPVLRNKAAESAARYQSVAIELRQLETQERQITQAILEAKDQIKQATNDIGHDEQLINDAQTLIESLQAEEQQLLNENANQEGRLPILEETRNAIAARLLSEEQDLQTKTRVLIETQTRRSSLLQQIKSDENRLNSNKTRENETRLRLQSLQSQNDFDTVSVLQEQITDLESRLHILQSESSLKLETVQHADDQITIARGTLNQLRETLMKLKAEQKPLIDFLSTDLAASHPVLDDIKADQGFELALAKALGDTLFGSLDETATIVWRGRQNISPPPLPTGVARLDEKVKTPNALSLAIGFIGYVHDRAQGDAAAADLKPGQMIVSTDGYLWRWDGLFIKPTTKDRQAIILEQKNRLAEIVAKLPMIESDVVQAQKSFDLAEQNAAQARAQQMANEQESRSTQAALNTARGQLQKLMQAQQHQAGEHARLSELLNLIETDNTERQIQIENQKSELQTLPDPVQSGFDQDVKNLQEQVAATQIEFRESSFAVERFNQEMARRQARLHGIADGRIAAQNRTARAHEHLSDLQSRLAQAQEKFDQLNNQPQEIKRQRDDLMSRATDLEQAKSRDTDALQAAENDVNQTARALREAESSLSSAKEIRAGYLAKVSGLIEHLNTMEIEINSLFGMPAATLVQQAQISFEISDEDLAGVDQKRQRKEKLIRDRDAIGPVNLRADVEAQEIESTLGKIISERGDLIAAIEELRGGIAKINLEARERLAAAFTTINAHFKDLFTRLFGGGQAYLQMVEADGDPLASGLEIYAQPPGKSLQSISLLSGGEQSLTAAALIFAMFLTNPSPICVLDEIDAPLDDANVDRICNLLRHITDTCQTRFLVVTHHRLTMAKMDRLFGVTMGEKGVSQLVSVDLSQQLDLLEAA